MENSQEQRGLGGRFLAGVLFILFLVGNLFVFNIQGRVKGGMVDVVDLPQAKSSSYLLQPPPPMVATLPTKPITTVVDKVLTVLPGEGLIAVARRGGVQLGLGEAIHIARESLRPILWYRPHLDKEAIIISPSLRVGEPVVIMKNGNIRIMTNDELRKSPP